MALNLAQASIKATGSTASSTLGNRFAYVINVKDYGAIGDGSHDDTTNIQAALDVALGTSSSPHGNSTELNKPIYFPTGNYKITAPLLVTSVKAALIYGDGRNESIITYSGGVYPGNSVANADNTVTPILMTNGFAYSTIERLGFSIPDSSTACIYLFGNFTTSPVTIRECVFQNATFGVLAGYLSPNNVSETRYEYCLFNAIGGSGLRLVGANTLNHNVYSCGFSSCGNGGHGSNSAAISVASGSVPVVIGCDFAGNLLDIYNAGSNPSTITGCRTESAAFAEFSSTAATFVACTQSNGSATSFVKLSGDARIMIDSCYPAGPMTHSGGNGSLWVRNLASIPSGFLTSFTTQIMEWSTTGNNTVATLPTATSNFKGVRTFVTDSNITSSGAFYTDISGHGGGSNTVPLWCDGSAWRIG